VNYGVGNYPQSVFSADLDGDGDRDLAVANYGDANVSVVINLSPRVAKPVPDGYWVPGLPVKAVKAEVSSIGLRWDSMRCPAGDYNVIYGFESGLSTYTLSGALAASGEAAFTCGTPRRCLPGKRSSGG